VLQKGMLIVKESIQQTLRKKNDFWKSRFCNKTRDQGLPREIHIKGGKSPGGEERDASEAEQMAPRAEGWNESIQVS